MSYQTVNKNIRFKTSMLRSTLCGYSDAYIVVKGTIGLLAAAAANENHKAEKNVAFKNNAPLRSCNSKINSTLINNAEDLDIVMPMYNLLEYSQNFSMTSGSLWNYYRDEIDDVDHNVSDGKSFKYKTKMIGKTQGRPERPERSPQPPTNQDGSHPPPPPQPPASASDSEVTIRLKYYSKF